MSDKDVTKRQGGKERRSYNEPVVMGMNQRYLYQLPCIYI